MPVGKRLTKAERAALRFILREGPGTLPETKQGRVTAATRSLMDAGYLELLNRLRPGPPMYEITATGRTALETALGPSAHDTSSATVPLRDANT